jgi:hypothetical protein
VEAAPEDVRPFVRELVLSVLDRLRRCGRPEVNRVLDACFREPAPSPTN